MYEQQFGKDIHAHRKRLNLPQTNGTVMFSVSSAVGYCMCTVYPVFCGITWPHSVSESMECSQWLETLS